MLLFPNAKINLGLDILRRRPDGYHDIETVMYPVPWRDVLEIVPAQGQETTLTVTGQRVDCPIEKNLVMKAYRAMEKRFKLPPVNIYLRKIIPDGAGLGGGSADAAFTLTGLNSLFELGLTDEDLASIASTLGADCPFFIYNRPMLCTGTGTDMTPIDVDLSGMQLLIVKPAVSVPTAAAYAGTHPCEPARSAGEIVSDIPVTDWPGNLKNDFESSVFPAYPAIAEVKERLLSFNPLYCAMSGSGASVFALWQRDKMSVDVARSFPEADTFTATL